MSTLDAPRPTVNPWIVSGPWDSAFIVLSPLVIIPGVLLATGFFTPESISVFALAFATMGHHLPGYMRCYGDRALFTRFRWRLTVVPPLIFTTALLFSLPNLFGIERNRLSGLTLVIMVWGVWHGMMQAYGFLRMYEAKRTSSPMPERLDLAACGAIFALGVVLSDSRMVSLAETFWIVGFPMFGPDWLADVRSLTVGLAGATLVAWAVMFIRRGGWRDTSGLMKSATLASTGVIYFFSGHITTNVLVGVAAFEIFHALQYDAIAWVYNKKLRERVGPGFGPLGFLFRNQWPMLALYAGAILAFGSIYLFASDPRGYAVNDGAIFGDSTLAILSAVFITSNILHFYVDGFIWKMREPETRKTLGISGAGAGPLNVGGMIHGGKMLAFFALIGTFLFMELRTPPDAEALAARSSTLAAWAPELPSILAQQSQLALEEGDKPRAIELAEIVAERRPQSHRAHAALASLYANTGDYDRAAASFTRAIELRPDNTRYQVGLAGVHSQRGDRWLTAAEVHYRNATRLSPEDPQSFRELGWMLYQRGRYSEAEKELRRAVALDPDHAVSHLNLGRALREQGQADEARAEFDHAARLGAAVPLPGARPAS